MLVNVYDGETMALVSSGVHLSEVMGEDQDEAVAAEGELGRTGRYWAGGGAAPLMLITRCPEKSESV